MSSLRHGPRRSTSYRRYPSDLTDSQWQLIEPLLPPPGNEAGVPCRPLIHTRRRIVEAILYVVRTGCAWRQLPHDFPKWPTVYWYFQKWNSDGTLDRLHDTLRADVRQSERRNIVPSAGIVDAQSVKGADTVEAIRVVMTLAKGSTGASAISLSTRSACSLRRRSPQPACKTAMVATE